MSILFERFRTYEQTWETIKAKLTFSKIHFSWNSPTSFPSIKDHLSWHDFELNWQVKLGWLCYAHPKHLNGFLYNFFRNNMCVVIQYSSFTKLNLKTVIPRFSCPKVHFQLTRKWGQLYNTIRGLTSRLRKKNFL